MLNEITKLFPMVYSLMLLADGMIAQLGVAFPAILGAETGSLLGFTAYIP